MVTHHLRQCEHLTTFKYKKGSNSNIPRTKPIPEILGHYGGLREVMPYVETLLNILDTDPWREDKLKDVPSLPRHVFWEDGTTIETSTVLEETLKIE